MPASSRRPSAFRECGENVFTAADASTAFTTAAATADWYAGNVDYDFAANKPKSATVKANSDQFTQVVWKGTGRVGFGIRDKTVVAWYCERGNWPRTESAFRKNVQKNCIEGNKKDKTEWNICYNERQLEAHNGYRTIHGTRDTGFLRDKAAAQAI